jgi:hypothetical protein
MSSSILRRAMGMAVACGLLATGAVFAATPYTATLKSNRNRLINDWAARKGYGDACQAWSSLSCPAKGAFLTLTHRLQISILPDWKSPLDHVVGLYSIRGDEDWDCHGGDDNRLFVSMDDYLWEAMAWASLGYVTTIDTNGNPDWRPSGDWAGPHYPFDASNETSYGHPRGQLHYWFSDWGFYVPVCRTDVPCIIDANMMEIDQDYDWNHPSSTECTYDTDGCDMCEGAWDRAEFDDGPGRMIYARQHPYVEGLTAGPNYNWAPSGCGRTWCNGCYTCEAETAWGYRLGYPATACWQVPCTSSTDYTCTLDGGTKHCDPAYGWIY